MASFARIGKATAITLGAAGLAGFSALAALRRPLPRTSGALRLPGLNAPVEVLRDRWGVPHIYAANSTDLFAAQGYVHAQDRLWQMEFQRRLAHGQLAEILGPLALDTDRFVRILGFSRVARREAELLDDATRIALEAYVHGVNAVIAQQKRRLPIEFTILRFQPRPWTITDILVWGKIMALGLSENWTMELLRARMVATVGPERASQLDNRYPDDQPLTIPRNAHYSPSMGADALHLADAAAQITGSPDLGQGSNAWVVGGARSSSGRPLLANDPHLAIQIPALWYENHLVGGDLHVTGASIPGAPGVILGHNERIAWGATNAMSDVQDLYIERFDPADPARYEFQGQWLQAELVREEIIVKGQPTPVVEGVRITRHGPIVSAFIGDGNQQPDGEALALRWTALDPSRITSAVLRINQAHDWDSFRVALQDWTVPAQNFVYADVDGHFGYALGGDIPLRAQGDGRLPVPGWTGEYEWNGFIPYDELPYTLDPEQGYVVTANNRITGEEYPYPINAEWLLGYRATRIHELLEQTDHHDADSFARIHVDVRSLPGLALAALAGRLPAHNVTAQHARDALAAWDGELTASSGAGLIYARLREKLLDTALAEIAAPLGLPAGLGAFTSLAGSGYLARTLTQIIERASARDDDWLPGDLSWDDVLRQAWQATVQELRDQYGDDVRTWKYGRDHALTLRHPLGVVPGLARIFNRGPFPTGGDIDTVCMGSLPRKYIGLQQYTAPSYRQICDPSDWDRSCSIQPTGQSGHPGSRHYADFVHPWLEGRYHPMLWSRQRVEESAGNTLTLQPAYSINQ